MIRKTFYILLFGLLLMGCSRSEATFYDTHGKSIQLSALKGKWVIINYWADWCDSCIAEIPELNQFYLHNHNTNIVFYGVNYDQLPLDSLKYAINKVGIEFPVLTEDPNSLLNLGQITAIPVTFILNPEGVVAKTIVGPSTEQHLTQILHELAA